MDVSRVCYAVEEAAVIYVARVTPAFFSHQQGNMI